MRDLMGFEAPLGLLGNLVEGALDRHTRSLLDRRNLFIKRVDESEEWEFLPGQGSRK
jgi:hypothetical protein